MDIPVHMRACSLYIYHCDATTQTLKDLSTEDLCELAKHRGIDYCAPFFRQERVVGAEMLLYKKEEFVSMLKTSTGEIFISGYIRGGFIKKKKNWLHSVLHFAEIDDAPVSHRREQCQSLVSVGTLSTVLSLRIGNQACQSPLHLIVAHSIY